MIQLDEADEERIAIMMFDGGVPESDAAAYVAVNPQGQANSRYLRENARTSGPTAKVKGETSRARCG